MLYIALRMGYEKPLAYGFHRPDCTYQSVRGLSILPLVHQVSDQGSGLLRHLASGGREIFPVLVPAG